MIDADTFLNIDDQTENKLRKREAIIIAEALLTRYHIPPNEQGFAYLLFDTDSRSNRDALMKWVHDQPDALYEYDIKERFEILSKTLDNVIQDEWY